MPFSNSRSPNYFPDLAATGRFTSGTQAVLWTMLFYEIQPTTQRELFKHS
eukprot:m.1552827 g.1552827  ORF g.1552827 m.1552827 type:complete len:50 (+) comp25267_c4_seq39:1605-1754(+)